MKANRKFIEEKAGVSAVIGVILMVAITVAIAATVYVYVSGMIGGGLTTVPTVSMSQPAGGNYILIGTVINGPVNNNTVDLSISCVNQTGVAQTGASLEDADTSGTVTGGDTIIGLPTDKGGAPYTVTLTYKGSAVGTAKYTPV